MTRKLEISKTYTKYFDSMFFFASNLGFDEDVVMDAIHDVFYKLCINNTSIEKIPHLKFYLFRALKNRLIDIHRLKKEFSGTMTTGDDFSHIDSFRLSVTIEDELIAKEELQEIQLKVEKVLSKLTDRQREAVYLRYIQGYDYKEITELMQISLESCRNLISKSLNIIRNSGTLLVGLFIMLDLPRG